MRTTSYRRGCSLLAVTTAGMVALVTPAKAQERADDNAVTQAEDAFGSSVGRETLGIYSAGNARGFSPTAAGNVRLDGLYFDPAFQLTSTISNASSIKVGLSAQGYPFAAPSGIVDYALNRPSRDAALSVVVNADSFGSGGIELDGSVPITEQLALRLGGTFNHVEFADGTSNWNYSMGAVARWRPIPEIEVTPFWTASRDMDDEAGPYFIPGGAYLPPLPRQRRFDGPEWVDFCYVATNHGVIASAAPAENWRIRVGAFRSVQDFASGWANLLLDVQPDGTFQRLIVADPPSRNVSLSGELRVTRSLAEGPRLHVFHLNLRDRDARREFDGSDLIDLGPGRIGERVTVPPPQPNFGQLSRDRVRQTTYGAAYEGRWRGVGEVALSLARAEYRKTTDVPGVPLAVSTARPWLYNGSVALHLAKGVTAYAGYARGLEESGVAPAGAANRNAPLPAILTQQKDAGVRIALTDQLRAVAGVFDLRRPYFSFDAANRFVPVGDVRSRGIELSLSGSVTPRLSVVMGGVLLDPKVETDATTARDIGRKPINLPTFITGNVNWRAPFVEGLSFDMTATHRGEAPSTTDNRVAIPARERYDLGGRYRFKLAGNNATLRVQLYNVLDKVGSSGAGPGIYVPNIGRQVNGYLAVDI